MAILITGALLRLWGIHWGLPNYLHYYSYHPDENVLFGAAASIDIFNGQFDPHFYNYGSLYIYLVNLGITLAAAFGWINLEISDIASNVNQVANIYLTGRIIAMIMGLATIYFVYILGRKAYGKLEGILAAAFLAVLPIHVMHSQFMAVDVPCTLFVVLSVIFGVRLLDGCRLRDYLFAGLFAGFAAGTKYNAGIVLIAPIILHFYADKSSPIGKIISPKLFGMITAAIVGFILATPGVFINQQQFIRDFVYEMHHASTGHGLVFVKTGSGYIYHLIHSLLPGMGLPILIISIAGILYAIKKHRPVDVALLAFVLIYYFMIGSAKVRFARYTIPMLPILTLFAGRLIADIYAWLSMRKASAYFLKNICTIVLALVIAYTALYSIALDNFMAAKDTRDRSIEWIRDHIEKGATIGLPTIPWFYTPPFDPEIAMSVDANERLYAAQGFTDYMLSISPASEWNADFLIQESPQYVVISEFEIADRLRIGDHDAKEYLRVLNSRYYIYKTFKATPNIMGIKFPTVVNLPHDMSYPNPKITIYAKKGVD